MKKIIILFIFLFSAKAFAQKIILAEKDSLGKYTFQEIFFPFNKSYFPIKISVEKERIVTIEYSGILDSMRKCWYILFNHRLVTINEVSSVYIEPVSGYYIFSDSTRFNTKINDRSNTTLTGNLP
ncbi:MAG: hypothetical protein ABIP51_20685 [Bacteroidia bacterium]